jgi:hypothetical protein
MSISFSKFFYTALNEEGGFFATYPILIHPDKLSTDTFQILPYHTPENLYGRCPAHFDLRYSYSNSLDTSLINGTRDKLLA